MGRFDRGKGAGQLTPQGESSPATVTALRVTGSPDDQLGLLWARLAALEQALDEARPWRQHCAGMLVSEQMNVAELQVEAGAEPASQGDSRDALGSQLKWAWAEIHALRSALEGRRGSWWRRQR